MRQKKAEADQLYQMYQEEKEKQRLEDAQANAQSHLKQIVGILQPHRLSLVRFDF